MTAKAPIGTAQLAASSPEQKAPVGNDGGFSYAAEIESYFSCNHSLKALPSIEVDPFSYLPYPVIVPPEMVVNNPTEHHHFHYESHPLLQGIGGQAVRAVYRQNLDASLHNSGPQSLHEAFSMPEELPHTDTTRLLALTLGLARFVPSRGYDLLKAAPGLRVMTDREYVRLTDSDSWINSPPVTRVRGQAVVAKYTKWKAQLENQVLMEDASYGPIHAYLSRLLVVAAAKTDLYDMVKEEFADTLNPEQGFAILQAAAGDLTHETRAGGQSVAEKYNWARNLGRLRDDLPEDCGDFLLGYLGSRVALYDVFTRLADQIKSDDKIAA